MNILDLLLRLRFFRRFRPNALVITGLAIIIALVMLAILAPYLTPYDPTAEVAQPYIPPFVNPSHPLGTNFLGQDVWARLVYGARNSLMVALLAVAIAAAVGVPLGLLSGYVGGVLDRVLTFLMDSMYAFPGIILAMIISFVLGAGLINVALSLAVIYIPTYFRVVRGTTLTVKEQLYVEAARAAGAPLMTTLRYYVAPNVVPVAVPVLALNFADAIITEAGLSFLGVGLPPTQPDWGVDLSLSRGDIVHGVWWTTFFPGLMIFIATLGFLLLGEGLSEVVRGG
ncbi:MAG: ABC transporter permease [Crenarchaeota archaeon]|nr:ABC transporter permease [Thermoproteota archaeon]